MSQLLSIEHMTGVLYLEHLRCIEYREELQEIFSYDNSNVYSSMHSLMSS